MPSQPDFHESIQLLHRMDDSRFTARHLRIYVTALFGHFMDGFVINMTGVIIPGLIVTYHLTSKQAGHFSSSLFAGMLIGAVDGLLLQYWLDPGFDPRAWVRSFMHSLFDGIGR